MRVELKKGDEPVTIADKKCSELIMSGLEESFPTDILISEESSDDPRRKNHSRVWFVDPIDGTKDFIRGEDGFCIMIGLCVDGTPLVGVVYQPVHKKTYAATPDIGCFCFTENNTPQKIETSGFDKLNQFRLVASKSHRSEAVIKAKEALGITDELNIGSVGLKLGLISEGKREVYVNPSNRTKCWDSCGPEAILKAAGGKLTDLDGNSIVYNKDFINHPRGLLATNGRAHPAAVAKLSSVFPKLD